MSYQTKWATRQENKMTVPLGFPNHKQQMSISKTLRNSAETNLLHLLLALYRNFRAEKVVHKQARQVRTTGIFREEQWNYFSILLFTLRLLRSNNQPKRPDARSSEYRWQTWRSCYQHRALHHFCQQALHRTGIRGIDSTY